MKRVSPIVDKNGNPFYVSARDPIGAEHLNAGQDWAVRYNKAALRDHEQLDGLHSRPYHVRAAIHIEPPHWSGTVPSKEGVVLGDSVFFSQDIGREATLDEHRAAGGPNPEPITVSKVSPGRFRVDFGFGIAIDPGDCEIVVPNMPAALYRHSSGAWIECTVSIEGRDSTGFEAQLSVLMGGGLGTDPYWQTYARGQNVMFLMYQGAA